MKGKIKMSYDDFVKEAVKRFYRNLKNSLMELLKEKTISMKTTVEELLNIVNKRL